MEHWDPILLLTFAAQIGKGVHLGQERVSATPGPWQSSHFLPTFLAHSPQPILPEAAQDFPLPSSPWENVSRPSLSLGSFLPNLVFPRREPISPWFCLPSVTPYMVIGLDKRSKARIRWLDHCGVSLRKRASVLDWGLPLGPWSPGWDPSLLFPVETLSHCSGLAYSPAAWLTGVLPLSYFL